LGTGVEKAPALDAVDEAVHRLAEAVRVPVVSIADEPADTTALLRLHTLLAEFYPRAHATLSRERVAGLSLLYTWKGTDTTLAPVILTGHLDTVPADTADAWTYPPFSGQIADGQIWGRGTLDNRSTVIGILEAVERLIGAGVEPERTIFLAFGHDEEIGGKRGAAAIAELLDRRGIRPAFVLDEGGFITHEAVPGIDIPVVMVGIAEKGSVTVDITAEAVGGHSAMPPANPATARLVRALSRLNNHAMPHRVDGATWSLFRASAPYMSLPLRIVFANRWLFEPIIARQLASSPSTDALIRTTTATTILRSGEKQNVVPDRATATLNFRTLPGDSEEDILAHIVRVIDDPEISVAVRPGSRASSGIAPDDGPAFTLLKDAIRSTVPYERVAIAPYLVIGGTDARHFERLTPFVYRYQPIEINPNEGTLLHGTDERISQAGYANAIRFYKRLLEQASRAGS
jgi:carboxypeptidase PM20D1